MRCSRGISALTLLFVAIAVFLMRTDSGAQEHPVLAPTFSPEALRLRALGKAQAEAAGENYDDAQTLAEAFPPVHILASNLAIQQAVLPLTRTLAEVFESKGLLFMVSDDSPYMGSNAYYLNFFDGRTLETANFLNASRYMGFTSMDTHEAILHVQPHGLADQTYYKISDGAITKTSSNAVVADRERVFRSNIYSPDQACSDVSSRISSTEFIRKGAAGFNTIAISKNALLRASRGVSGEKGVSVYCRSFGTSLLIWLSGEAGGVTFLASGMSVSPLFNEAPIEVTAHYLVFTFHRSPADHSSHEGYFIIKG